MIATILLAWLLFSKPNLKNDPDNCGATNNKCDAGWSCVEARCVLK